MIRTLHYAHRPAKLFAAMIKNNSLLQTKPLNLFLKNVVGLIIFIAASQFCPAQIITTLAGNGTRGNSGNGGPANAASLNEPWGCAVDSKGNVYIADQLNHVIRKVDPAGVITVFAGNGQAGWDGDGGPASSASLYYPFSLAFDRSGALFVIDNNGFTYKVRKIDPAGIITTYAGCGIAGSSADGTPASGARFGISISSLVVDPSGQVLINDVGRLRYVDANGLLQTKRTADECVTYLDNSGNGYCIIGNEVWKTDASGNKSLVAGQQSQGYDGDGGPATAAHLSMPYSVVKDRFGNLFIADYGNHVVRKVDANGIISTYAGTGVQGYSGDGGAASNAQITYPISLTVDSSGNLYVTDPDHHCIRKISACATNQQATLKLVVSSNIICEGEKITCTAIATNEGDKPVYRWSVNGIVQAEKSNVLTLNNPADGDEIGCVLTSALPCTTPATAIPLRVKVAKKPVLQLEPQIIISPGGQTTLQVKATGSGLRFQWTPPDGLSNASVQNPVARPVKTTVYSVSATSPQGCVATANTKVIVYKKLQMPNAFTPNNDQKNDDFGLPADVTFDLTSLTIYNRWGGIVFQTKNASSHWDGKYKNVPANSGAYVYVITGSELGKPITLRGTVLLVR